MRPAIPNLPDVDSRILRNTRIILPNSYEGYDQLDDYLTIYQSN